MDLQFFGANCLSLSYKSTRLVTDDNLNSLGGKPVLKDGDVALFTFSNYEEPKVNPKIILDSPGEYEVADISINGIAARSHMDEEGKMSATIFKIATNDVTVLITGHIYPEISDAQLEAIGMVDVLIVPVGGNGYTLDPDGALTLIKEIEPKLVIPTHYNSRALKYPVPQKELSEALKEMAMEPIETVAKLKLKPADLSDVTQLIVLEA